MSCPSLDGPSPVGWDFYTAELNNCTLTLHSRDGSTPNFTLNELPSTKEGYVYAAGQWSYSECANGVE